MAKVIVDLSELIQAVAMMVFWIGFGIAVIRDTMTSSLWIEGKMQRGALFVVGGCVAVAFLARHWSA